MRLRARLRVLVGPGALRAEARRRGRVVWAAEVGYDGASELAERLAELVAAEELPAVGRQVDVRLSGPVVQVRELEGLPAVSDTGLAGIVAHQPHRFFRRNGAPLVTDAVWRGTAFRRTTPRTALAAAAEEPVVTAIVAGLGAAGLSVAEIQPDLTPDVPLSLLPGPERGVRYRARLRRLAWMGGSAAALWGVVAGALVLRERWAIARVDHELAALQAPVQALLTARTRSADVRRMIAVVHEADRDGARLSRRLVELARALPDSAFFTSVALRADGSGVLAGAAPRSADVVVRLERRGVVSRPHLDGQGARESLEGAGAGAFHRGLRPGTTMSPRDRRALGWGAAVVVGGLLLGRVVPAAVRWWRGAQATLAERTVLLAREQHEIGTVAVLEDSAKTVQAAFIALAPEILTGGTDAEALADIEGRVSVIAGQHRTKVLRLDGIADSSSVARLKQVRVTVAVESDWGGLVGFLKGLDEDPAAIGVQSLDVTAADPASSSARPEVLHAELELTGWYLHAPRPEDLRPVAVMASERRP